MDWRAGNQTQPNSSAFRGMGSGGRGRGRGRDTQHNNIRGSHGTSPKLVSSPLGPSSGPSAPQHPVVIGTGLKENLTQSKQSSGKTNSRAPRPSSSSNRINSRKATGSSDQTTATPLPNPSRIPTSISNASQGDAGSPTNITQASNAHSKPSRKRSHTRNRSSSKATSKLELTVANSLTSLDEKEKMSSNERSQTDIEALVERVRAMAMAGSALEREKEKDKSKFERYTPSEGHLDWAGDLDDGLPDLDDWIKPKLLPEDEGPGTVLKLSEVPSITIANETGIKDLSIPAETSGNIEKVSKDTSNGDPAQDISISNKRTRSRHNKRRKSHISLAESKSVPSVIPADLGTSSSNAASDCPKMPLFPPGPAFLTKKTPEAVKSLDNLPSTNGSHHIHQVFNVTGITMTPVSQPEEETPSQSADIVTADDAEGSILPMKSGIQIVPSAGQTTSSSDPDTTQNKKNNAWIESVDLKLLSPRRFPGMYSDGFHAGHTRSTSPTNIRDTRSHGVSPERRFRSIRGGDDFFTHHRARSSPHTGPGTRTHSSRPVISRDAFSMISRTLGVASAGTSPRKHPVELGGENSK